jgi:coenzyme F420-reducing hydrogenase gamma subunit
VRHLEVLAGSHLGRWYLKCRRHESVEVGVVWWRQHALAQLILAQLVRQDMRDIGTHLESAATRVRAEPHACDMSVHLYSRRGQCKTKRALLDTGTRCHRSSGCMGSCSTSGVRHQLSRSSVGLTWSDRCFPK